MKKIGSIIIALCCCTVMMAQNSYRALLEEFQLIANADFGKEKMVEALSKVAELKGLTAEAGRTAASKFYDEKLFPELMDLVEAEFKGNVTEADLNELIKAYKTPAGKTALANSLKCSSEENQKKLSEAMMPGLTALLMGGNAEKVKAPQCSESYKKKFSKYYELSNLSSTLDAVMSSLKQTVAQGGDAAADEAVKAILDKLGKFMGDNSENIMLHTCVDALTEADLDFFNKVLSTPAGLHVTAASKTLAPKSAAYGIQSVADFMNSLGN